MPNTHYYFVQNSRGHERFDVLIATCGYESRSTEIAKRYENAATRVFAYTYPNNHIHSFEPNLAYFKSAGTVRDPESLSSFAGQLSADLRDSIAGIAEPQIAIDISSFNRDRIAAIIRALAEIANDVTLSVAFLYAMSTFESHEDVVESTVLANGPLEGFEGWTGDPSSPVACVVGLGFESLIALAALETLEPGRTVAFIGKSGDGRFYERVLRDNASLLGSPEVATIPYELGDPFESLHAIEGVVHALLGDYRVVLVPLGPKVFALLALLVAWEYRDSVAVWRVSSDQGGRVEDRIPSGETVALQTVIRASRPIDEERPATG